MTSSSDIIIIIIIIVKYFEFKALQETGSYHTVLLHGSNKTAIRATLYRTYLYVDCACLNCVGRTALHCAVRNARQETAEKLLQVILYSTGILQR